MNDIAQILRDAAHLLDDEGWCQKVGNRYDGARCTTAAIRAAAKQSDFEDFRSPAWDAYKSACQAVADYVNEHRGVKLSSWYELPFWNDEPGRTHGQVVSTLRKVADHVSV